MHARDDPPPAPAPWRGRLRWLAVLALLATSLGSGLLMDDWFHVERASRPFGLQTLDFVLDTQEQGLRLWVHPAPVHVRFMRPISSASFWLDRRLWGLRPWGYHLTNIGVQVLAMLGVLAIARAIGLAGRIASLTALAWGVSAAGVPAVQWISGRTELLCGAAALGAAYGFLRWDLSRRWSHLALATALAALAVGSKETGVAVAPFAWCLLRTRRALRPGTPARPALGGLLVLAAPAIAALACRLLLPGFGLPEAPYADTVRTAGDAAWFALKPAWALIATLFSLPVSHLGPLDQLRAHPALALGVLAVGAVAVAAVGRAAGWRVAAPLLAAFVLGLAPSLPVLMTTIYFYLPAAALALLLGAAMARRPGYAAWLVLWIVVGSLAHIGIATVATAASRRQDRQIAFLESSLAAHPARRLVLVDAPFWSYGLPAALRTRGRARDLETWFVNFTPGVDRVAPSTVTWISPRELRVRLGPARGLLATPVERFLAFGGTPGRAALAAADSAIRITAIEAGEHPRELAIRFASDAALRSTAIVQLTPGGLGRAIPPGAAAQGPVPSP